MKITKWDNSDVVYESEKETIREVVIEAVGKYADLGGADLRDADLGDANLRGADLGGADLRDANLGGADLYHSLFYGRGGKTIIKKSQITQFHEALGIVVED